MATQAWPFTDTKLHREPFTSCSGIHVPLGERHGASIAAGFWNGGRFPRTRPCCLPCCLHHSRFVCCDEQLAARYAGMSVRRSARVQL